MTITKSTRLFAPMMLCALLSACASSPPKSTPPSDSVGTGRYKVGQPYQIKGEWYYPREDYSYDETGIASWYGADFHNLRTANGEIFNKDELTAAHKTLPLPSLARVTNLENGKSIVVRINDRGPFSGARIIDMSQRSAQLLGFENQGTAKVRVQVLADESKAIADAMRRYGAPSETPPANSQPAATASIQTETLAPLRTTPETRREMMTVQPVPVAVQMPVGGEHNLYIQAGSFSVMENAQKLQQSLKSIGNATVQTAVVNGKTFYRVRVGPIATVAKADATLSQIRRAGVSGARTIVD